MFVVTSIVIAIITMIVTVVAGIGVTFTVLMIVCVAWRKFLVLQKWTWAGMAM